MRGTDGRRTKRPDRPVAQLSQTADLEVLDDEIEEILGNRKVAFLNAECGVLSIVDEFSVGSRAGADADSAAEAYVWGNAELAVANAKLARKLPPSEGSDLDPLGGQQ